MLLLGTWRHQHSRITLTQFQGLRFFVLPRWLKGCGTCKVWFTFNSPLFLVSVLLVSPLKVQGTYTWWALDSKFCLPSPKGTSKPLNHVLWSTKHPQDKMAPVPCLSLWFPSSPGPLPNNSSLYVSLLFLKKMIL